MCANTQIYKLARTRRYTHKPGFIQTHANASVLCSLVLPCRAQNQATKFEEDIGLPGAVIFFDCPEEEMEKRLLKRGETSGRSDDNTGRRRMCPQEGASCQLSRAA